MFTRPFTTVFRATKISSFGKRSFAQYPIKVPDLGDSIVDAEIKVLYEGNVEVDGMVCMIETHKAVIPIIAPVAGSFKASVQVDDIVLIGDVIGHITD